MTKFGMCAPLSLKRVLEVFRALGAPWLEIDEKSLIRQESK